MLVSAAGLTRLADLERLTTREAEQFERVACGPPRWGVRLEAYAFRLATDRSPPFSEPSGA